jgi:hypothetical protein
MAIRRITLHRAETLSDQLDRQKRTVSYDMYDMTVRQLIDMVAGGLIDISPEYQRHFVWDHDRESELIESIYLGIPVPSLYMAANRDGTWEVVDGVQRLSTLIHFCGGIESLTKIKRPTSLILSNLRKLPTFNGRTFAKLPPALQINFQLRPVRVTTLNDKSDIAVRYDLFERLNTGGVLLHPQEIRNSVIRGRFRDQLKELAIDPNFRKVVKLADNEQKSAAYEECVLRFFAYSERYKLFDHSVKEFLTDYMIEKSEKTPDASLTKIYRRTMAWLASAIPNGIVRGTRSITPINLYEAVAVGASLALQQKPLIQKKLLKPCVNSEELKKLTTGATNSRNMVVGRIEFVRDALLK